MVRAVLMILIVLCSADVLVFDSTYSTAFGHVAVDVWRGFFP
jgi:hypothetical protein